MATPNQYGYNPGSTYGAPTGSLYDSPLVRDFMSPDLQQSEYARYLTDYGLGGFGRKERFAQNQYGKIATGYGAAQLTNPTLHFRDYMSQHLGPGYFDQAWRSLTPEQRGEQPGRFTGPLRWIGRG